MTGEEVFLYFVAMVSAVIVICVLAEYVYFYAMHRLGYHQEFVIDVKEQHPIKTTTKRWVKS